ncbi:MAG: outer membrane protein [Planctomycetota bacterium]|jgi:lipid A oxidase
MATRQLALVLPVLWLAGIAVANTPERASGLQLDLGHAFAAAPAPAGADRLAALAHTAPGADPSDTSGGEFFIAGYIGKAWNQNTNVTLNEPSTMTNLEYRAVLWNDDSFVMPIYWGARFGYWLEKEKNGFGFAIDFTHAKMIANTGASYEASGIEGGVPVSGTVPMATSIQRMEFVDGNNFLTFNVMYRNFPEGERNDTFGGRIQPYIGAGMGVAIPQVNVLTSGSSTDEYQFAAVAFQFMVGFNWDIAGPLTTFIEYKFNYADLDVDLTGGGSIRTEAITHQLVVGLGLRF